MSTAPTSACLFVFYRRFTDKQTEAPKDSVCYVESCWMWHLTRTTPKSLFSFLVIGSFLSLCTSTYQSVGFCEAFYCMLKNKHLGKLSGKHWGVDCVLENRGETDINSSRTQATKPEKKI